MRFYKNTEFKSMTSRILRKNNVQKNNPSQSLLEVCGGVCICRDSALCLDFLILLCLGRFWASTFAQWRIAPSQ